MKLFNLLIVLFFLLAVNFPAYSEIYEIDAAKNSINHNNIGMNYFNEGYYYGAIQEFKIAISLNPQTQASAAYYDNLGKTYLVIGYPVLAEDCFLNAIKYNPMNLSYKQHLAETYRKMGKSMLNKKLSYFLNSKKSQDALMAGLIYIEKGDIKSGVTKLDEFCINEPNLIITEGVRAYIKTLQ